MAKPPESTKTSLRQRLAARARERWPQLGGIDVRWHGQFAYVSGQLPDGTDLPLFRLRYADSATTWGFAIYRASHDDYAKSILPSGWPAGTPQEALDCACGLYLNDPAAWLDQLPPDELTGAPTSAFVHASGKAMGTTPGEHRAGGKQAVVTRISDTTVNIP